MILRDWRANAGIKQTIILSEPRGHSAANEHSYRAALEEEQLAVEAIRVDESSIRSALPDLLRRKRCGILLTASAAGTLHVARAGYHE